VVLRNVNTADANALRRASLSRPENSLFVGSNKGSLSPAGSPWTSPLLLICTLLADHPCVLSIRSLRDHESPEITNEPPTGVFISRLVHRSIESETVKIWILVFGTRTFTRWEVDDPSRCTIFIFPFNFSQFFAFDNVIYFDMLLTPNFLFISS